MYDEGQEYMKRKRSSKKKIVHLPQPGNPLESEESYYYEYYEED